MKKNKKEEILGFRVLDSTLPNEESKQYIVF